MLNSPLLRQVFKLLGQTYLVTLIGLLIGIFSARSLSVEDRGLLASLLLISQLCSRIGAMGFEQVLHQQGSQLRLRDFHLAGFLGSLLTFPVALVGLHLSHYPLWFAAVLVGVAGFISVLRSNVAFLIHMQDMRQLTLLNVLQAISQLALYALAFSTHDVTVFFWLWAANVIVFAVMSSFFLRRQSTDSKCEPLEPTQVWKKGFSFTAINIPEIALSFCVELPIVRSVLGGSASGLYAISNTLTGMYYQVFTAITSISIRKPERLPLRLIYGATALIGIFIVVAAPYIIGLLFGERYQGAMSYLIYMLPVTFILGLVRMRQVASISQAALGKQSLAGLILLAMLGIGLIFPTRYLVPWIALSYLTYAAIGYLFSRNTPIFKEKNA